MSLPHGISPDDVKLWFDGQVPGKVRWTGYQALCRSPLREDKNPSFSFSAEKGTWHDHATRESGGLLALAERLGVAPPWGEGGKEAPPPRPQDGFRQLWDSAQAADAGHQYLQFKGVASAEGLRQSGEGLLVPCYSESGELVGIERVAPDGAKRHLGSKQGIFPFGKLEPGSPVVLAEGLATCASIHEVTSLPVLCCFGASGIKRTAEALRRKHPGLEIVAATDNDEAGRRAAQESGGLAVIPDGPEHYDWNDYMKERGAEEAQEAFLQKLEAAREAAREKAAERERPAILDAVSAPAPETATRPEKVWHFPRRHLNVLAADPGMGKSLLLSKVAADLSIGAAPLGGRAGPVRKTLYLNGECGRDYFNWRFRASGWEYSKEHFFVVHQEDLAERGIELNLDTSVGRENLETLLREIRPDLLVIDSLPAFSGEDLNDGTVQNELGKFLKGVAARHDLAVVLVTHLRKRRLQDHGAEPTLAEIQGSNAIAKLCNVALALYEKEIDVSGELCTVKVCRSVKSWGPQVAPFGFHFPELDEDTLVLEAVDTPSSKKLSGAWERVRALLGGEFTRQEVEELLGVSDKTAKSLLSGWRQRGKIEAIGKGPKTMYTIIGEGSGKALSLLPRSGADEAIATVESGNPIFPRSDSVGDEKGGIESGKNRFPDSNPVIPINYIGSGKYIDCGVPITSPIPGTSPIDETAAEEDSLSSADALPPPAQERYRDAYERMRRANVSHETAHARAMDRARDALRKLQGASEEVA